MQTDEPTPAFLRLFIAFAIPQNVQKVIGRAQSQLQRSSPPGAVRWTRPEQFHVTLKFLGDVPAAQVEALKVSVSGVSAGFPPLQLSAHGIGFFPNIQRPRVVWAGADDNLGKLAELHRQLDEAARPFAPAEKPERFAGHITLGRFKPGHPAAIDKLLARAEVHRRRHFGDWEVGQMDIFRSELTSAGAMHSLFASLPLAG
jgi:2'-5' RNA ligase